MSYKKIAIVADWLIDFGGAEVVLSHLLEMFPEADIYTSVNFMKHPMLTGRKIFTSWIQKIPFLNRKHKLAGILRPWAFQSFDLSGYDLVICSSSAESKQVALGKWRERSHAKVIVYCHTPIRYYWSHAKEYEDMMEFGILNPLVKWMFRLTKKWMQKVDYKAAQKVDAFIANSKNVQERILKYYTRNSDVIYPGVNTPISLSSHVEEMLKVPKSEEGEYYFSIGRCIPYKKFDLLVEAFNSNGKKLILATGTNTLLYRTLKAQSKPNIEWRFYPSDEEKWALMYRAKAFLFPSDEDFGIVPVEAMMCGTPVIAYGEGGALETVAENETGMFFRPQNPQALNETIEEFEKKQWNKGMIENHAENFSKERFQENFFTFMTTVAGK